MRLTDKLKGAQLTMTASTTLYDVLDQMRPIDPDTWPTIPVTVNAPAPRPLKPWVAEVAQMMEGYSYKHGTELVVAENGEGNARIVLICYQPPSTRPNVVGPTVPITVIRDIAPEVWHYADAEEKRRVLNMIMVELTERIELHEAKEWLRFDGTHVRDPHPELRGPYDQRAEQVVDGER